MCNKSEINLFGYFEIAFSTREGRVQDVRQVIGGLIMSQRENKVTRENPENQANDSWNEEHYL